MSLSHKTILKGLINKGKFLIEVAGGGVNKYGIQRAWGVMQFGIHEGKVVGGL